MKAWATILFGQEPRFSEGRYIYELFGHSSRPQLLSNGNNLFNKYLLNTYYVPGIGSND